MRALSSLLNTAYNTIVRPVNKFLTTKIFLTFLDGYLKNMRAHKHSPTDSSIDVCAHYNPLKIKIKYKMI
jgi:hypothetical protein